MRSLVFLLFLLSCGLSSAAQTSIIRGRVKSFAGYPLPFANVYVKGTTQGTTTNEDGYYSLELKAGHYEIVFRYLGYKLKIFPVDMNLGDQVVDVYLEPEEMLLKEVRVAAEVEDPAYAIIRKAMDKRKFYNEQVEAYSCEVYIKGIQRMHQVPERILGIKSSNIEINGVSADDTTMRGIFYLSESVSEFHYKKPKQIKELMISSKVSGQNNAFSYNKASEMLFNFYENIVEVEAISERGFISPIAANALFYYRYRLLGAFYENGYLVNKIEVRPRRKNDPCFRGIMYIVEGEWRIHSTELYLTRDAQIEFVDTLHINQVFAPLNTEIWMPVSNKFTFNFDVMGIRGSGYFLGINRNYQLNPAFAKGFFNGEEMKVLEESNQKDSAYWAAHRPIPLTAEEQSDYHKKDSVSEVRNSKSYLDSIDRQFNRFRIGRFLISGYRYENRYTKESFSISGLLPSLPFNTVEGWLLNMNLAYQKKLERKRSLYIIPTLRYGFSNQHFNAKILWYKDLDAKKFSALFFNGGTDVAQFNNRNPITPFVNTLYSLLDEKNYMKLYEKAFVRAGYRQELINGVYLRTETEFAERKALLNSSNFKLVDDVVASYSSNDPLYPDSFSSKFPTNQSLYLFAGLVIRFKQKYYTRPYQKVITGSAYPALFITYKKGIPSLLGSDVDYDFVRAGIKDDMKAGLLGTFSYNISYASFLNKRKLYFIDYNHFSANRTVLMQKVKDQGDIGEDNSTSINGFNLLAYYVFSTSSDFFEGHAEHHFNGFLINKIPYLRKTKVQEVLGIHYLNNGPVHYWESSFGIEHIGIGKLLPGLLRIDYVVSFSNVRSEQRQGLRLGIGF